jgi:putative transposase
MKSYKFKIYPSKKQEEEMCRHRWLSKELWNKLLEKTKKKYEKEKKFFTRSELQVMVKGTELYSQTAQGIAHRLYRAVKAKVKAKKEGKKRGFPRFKSIDRMKSLHYPQYGFSLEKKLKVTPFGEIAIKKHREITGKIKTLTLKREPTGKWFAIFCVEEEKKRPKENKGEAVGLDLGLMNLATLSDGKIIKHPHQFRKFEERLAFIQRKFSKKKKGSENRKKAKKKVSLIHEQIANTRADYLHKQANELLSRYSLVALEDLDIQDMAEQEHGKNIYDSSWGMLANILCYKAEEAGCRVVFVDSKDTSKLCSNCGTKTDKSLWDRVHKCPACGLELDRDLNAAVNILIKATEGHSGSNACNSMWREMLQKEATSMKQEAHIL